jgi:hypothetical protein
MWESLLVQSWNIESFAHGRASSLLNQLARSMHLMT